MKKEKKMQRIVSEPKEERTPYPLIRQPSPDKKISVLDYSNAIDLNMRPVLDLVYRGLSQLHDDVCNEETGQIEGDLTRLLQSFRAALTLWEATENRFFDLAYEKEG